MWKPLTLCAALAPLMTMATLGWSGAEAQIRQPPCDIRSKLVERLALNYKETSIATGLAHDGKLVEVLTNASGETWSIIVTSPQGLSCLVATGEGWRKLEPVLAEPKI